ncbi:MAG: VOC family protein [Candidatus Arcticimaribacter sp.]
MILHPYFVFNGQAKEALVFYAKALGIEHGELKTYGDSSMPHEPHQKDWIIHSELIFNGSTLAMFADSADVQLSPNPNIHISLNYTDLEEMKVAFARLAEGGEITMPLEKQFWNATFGQLKDRFGLHWMMNCDHTT